MKTVHKFPIRTGDGRFHVEIPVEAKILLVEEQRNVPCIWAEVETDNPMAERIFQIVGTGHPIPAGLAHVASYQSVGGVFVWHLYEFLV